MPHFIMLIRDSNKTDNWDAYIEQLLSSGKFRGGSSLGNGVCVQKDQSDTPSEVTGFMRLEVDGLAEAKALLAGNPAFEAGYPVDLLEEVED